MLSLVHLFLPPSVIFLAAFATFTMRLIVLIFLKKTAEATCLYAVVFRPLLMNRDMRPETHLKPNAASGIAASGASFHDFWN
jgi:hypothetical protein